MITTFDLLTYIVPVLWKTDRPSLSFAMEHELCHRPMSEETIDTTVATLFFCLKLWNLIFMVKQFLYANYHITRRTALGHMYLLGRSKRERQKDVGI